MKLYSNRSEYLLRIAKRIAMLVTGKENIEHLIVHRTKSKDIRLVDHGLNILVLNNMIELQPLGRSPLPSTQYRTLISKAMDNEHVPDLNER